MGEFEVAIGVYDAAEREKVLRYAMRMHDTMPLVMSHYGRRPCQFFKIF